MIRLGVNIDHIATVRQARRGKTPDPVAAALACQQAGAQSIVCHLREDRRHIHDEDVRCLKKALRIPLNLEMSIAPNVVSTALAVCPHQVTLVPERRQELTTEGGLDVASLQARLRPLIRRFCGHGIAVSLFIDPAAKQITASRDVGAAIIELHTGCYANATGRKKTQQFAALKQAAALGRRLDLAVAAGHGLDYDNIAPIALIPEIEEVNIGFSIISRALDVGLSAAVRQMCQALR